MNIRNAIFKVFSANFLQLISSLIVGFFVPAILEIEAYASLKTYSLYVSYVGFLHLGFIDGMYIKYGGKNLREIDKNVLKGEHFSLIIFQLIISAFFIFLGIIKKNYIIILFSLSILPIMIQAFFKYLFQATGEFGKYSKIMYMYTCLYAVFNVVLALILKSQNYIYYCLTSIIANILSVIFVEVKFLNDFKNVKIHIDKNIFENIKIGFFIMLGNLSVMGLFGIDKWFIKLFFDTKSFAYYSFAVSMLNLINTLISAISITFYNYLFNNNYYEKVNNLKSYLLSIGGVASLGYFALSFIINNFIVKYIPALNIISITFAIFPYMVLINALYVNLYKVNKDEKHYFKVVISMLIISIIYNILALILFNSPIAIAFATILTVITWVIYSSKDLKNIELSFKDKTYMCVLTISFLATANLCNWLIGGIVYGLILLLTTYIYKKDIYKEVLEILLKIMNRGNR